MKSDRTNRLAPHRRRMSVALLSAAIMMLALLWLTSFSSPAVHADETNRSEPNSADVFVQFDDSDVAIRSIQFTDPISGIQALNLSGLDVIIASTDFGPVVCSIEGVGCPADNCFCDSKYWGYNYWADDAWQSYTVGAGGSIISQTGSIEGWRWGEFGNTLLPPSLAHDGQDALNWLSAQQDSADGGFGGVGASVETALAIGANSERATDWSGDALSPSLADYLTTNGAMFADNNSAAAGKLAVALAATGVSYPDDTLRPSDYYSATLGAYNSHIGFHTWGLLGAQALGDDIPSDAIQYIKDGVLPGGGWEWMKGFGADTNTTSIAIQALLASGEPVTSTEVVNGLTFLRSAQNSDGGFTYDPASEFGTDSDANSTAYAMQALWASCQDPIGVGWTKNGRTPLDFLRTAQLSDGSVEWIPATGTNLLSTQQVVPALLGSAYPLNGSGPACPDRLPPTKTFLPQIASVNAR